MDSIVHDHGVEDLDQLRIDIETALTGKKKKKKKKRRLEEVVRESHPADVAEVVDGLDLEGIAQFIRALLEQDAEMCADVLVELESSNVAQLFPYLSIIEWSRLFAGVSDDDAAWLLELFPEEAGKQLVSRMDKSDQADLMELLTYPEDTAGRIMTNEFVAMDKGATVAAAVERIRNTRDFDPTNLFFVYVTDHNKLVGMVSLRQLLLNKKTDRLESIMRTDVNALHPLMDQEQVAELVRKHDDVSVPVLDDHGHVLGIITVDDVLDVIDEESEEDLYKLVGTSEEELLVGDNTRRIVQLRLPWLFAACCGSMLVALIMKFSEGGFFGAKAADIFIFVPMVCAMGGNVGVQSSTIMARELSSNTLDGTEARRTTFKEAKVGLTLGLICGTLVAVAAVFIGGIGLSITVVIAMTSAMTTAATTGTVIPIIMKRAGIDPALATGPFVTSFNDVMATLVYFVIAFTFLDHIHIS